MRLSVELYETRMSSVLSVVRFFAVKNVDQTVEYAVMEVTTPNVLLVSCRESVAHEMNHRIHLTALLQLTKRPSYFTRRSAVRLPIQITRLFSLLPKSSSSSQVSHTSHDDYYALTQISHLNCVALNAQYFELSVDRPNSSITFVSTLKITTLD